MTVPNCQVQKLIKEHCNDECSNWSTCPLAELLMKTVVNLFSSYEPRIRGEPE